MGAIIGCNRRIMMVAAGVVCRNFLAVPVCHPSIKRVLTGIDILVEKRFLLPFILAERNIQSRLGLALITIMRLRIVVM